MENLDNCDYEIRGYSLLEPGEEFKLARKMQVYRKAAIRGFLRQACITKKIIHDYENGRLEVGNNRLVRENIEILKEMLERNNGNSDRAYAMLLEKWGIDDKYFLGLSRELEIQEKLDGKLPVFNKRYNMYQKARKRFIEGNLRLVVSIAKKYLKKNIFNLDDLVGFGNEGLVKAVDRFDYKKRGKFSTYARWWIRQSIERRLHIDGRTIRIPVYAYDEIRKIKTIFSEMTYKLERKPSHEELAERTGFNVKKISTLLLAIKKIYSFSFLVGELGRGKTIPPLEKIINDERREIIEKKLNELSKRERRIIQLRYEFEDGKKYTLKKIGEEFNITRERVRQIKKEALRKLSKSI